MRCPTTILALLFCLPIAGCGRHSEEATPAQLAPEDYGRLPALKNSSSPKLREELDRIVEQGGTPEQLSEATIADAENVAAELRDLFPADKVASILLESQKIFPTGQFEFNPLQLQKAIGFRKKYESEQLRARQALKRPRCRLDIDFMSGFLADLTIVDVLRICGRLEAFQAAEALADDKPHEAIDSLEAMLLWAAHLAAEKHSQARAQGAFARTEAFVVLQATARHEKTTRAGLVRLYEAVQRQLKQWPNDADAVVGDRALGMHAYEMIRDGNLVALLTDEEIEEFSKEAKIDDFIAATKRNADRDELYYLQTMRQIIESCRQPYYARLELFDAVRDELEQKKNLSEFPTVAARLLLPEVRKAQAMQAQDRANWEAWAVALAAATGRQPLPFAVSPLTGRKYACQRDGDFIVVGNFGTGVGNDTPTLFAPFLGGE
ncbi:MAG: hypothetical protein JXB62_18230 [Pirellulales bacterium]|nr:hypothetical protein [Pirellulales bacterium]